MSIKPQTFPAALGMMQIVVMFLILTLIGCQDQDNLSIGTGPTTTPVAADPASSITVSLLGDVMLGRGVQPTSETFAYLKPFLSSTDLALANLESPLTGVPPATGSSYVLCAPSVNVHVLADAGFDLLSIANNHNLDCGTNGLAETKAALVEAGLGYIGPDPEPVYRSINGIPVALLAFDATTDSFDIESAVQAVRLARETGALVLVSIHWGMEYQAGASFDQKQLALQLADAGTTLIWGHHPHVLQPSEWIGGRKTLVLYSLGNALFDQHGLESTRQSVLMLVTLNSEGVVDFRAVPFLIDVQNNRVVQAGDDDAQRIEQYFK